MATIAGLAVLMGAGCSRPPHATYAAQGTVKFKSGEPLVGGLVEFRPAAGSPKVVARGTTGPDGRFTLSTFASGDGAVEGEHQAVVFAPLAEGDSDEPSRAKPAIDPRLSSYDTSGLKFKVSSNAEQNEFAITVKAP